MKTFFKTPMTIFLLLIGTVLIGSNVSCTGRASNNANSTEITQENKSTTASSTEGVATLTESNFDESIKTGVVLVDFWATWCGPCRLQSPIIEEVSTEMVGKANVYKVNVDQSSTIANRYSVYNIPTMILFNNGVAVGQFVGLTQKSDIIKAIEKYTTSK